MWSRSACVSSGRRRLARRRAQLDRDRAAAGLAHHCIDVPEGDRAKTLRQASKLYDSLIIATSAHKTGRGFAAAEAQRQTWLRQFVQTFGTDENDESTTFNGTIPQALVMMNGGLINSAISIQKGSLLQQVVDSTSGDIHTRPSKGKPRRTTKRRTPSAQQLRKNRYQKIPRKIRTLFMITLARMPTAEEMNSLNGIFKEGQDQDPIHGLQDVFWAVLNSNEFITNH
mgnify:CR=1 FL=1